jgi:hypothetical protein
MKGHQQTWKACWGQPLKSSNLLSSALLTSQDAERRAPRRPGDQLFRLSFRPVISYLVSVELLTIRAAAEGHLEPAEFGGRERPGRRRSRCLPTVWTSVQATRFGVPGPAGSPTYRHVRRCRSGRPVITAAVTADTAAAIRFAVITTCGAVGTGEAQTQTSLRRATPGPTTWRRRPTPTHPSSTRARIGLNAPAVKDGHSLAGDNAVQAHTSSSGSLFLPPRVREKDAHRGRETPRTPRQLCAVLRPSCGLREAEQCRSGSQQP